MPQKDYNPEQKQAKSMEKQKKASTSGAPQKNVIKDKSANQEDKKTEEKQDAEKKEPVKEEKPEDKKEENKEGSKEESKEESK